MKEIWKYAVRPGGHPTPMKEGAKIIHFVMHGDTAVVWAEVDPKAREVYRNIFYRGTGWSFTAEHTGVHLFTHITKQGFVWHYYDRGEQDNDCNWRA